MGVYADRTPTRSTIRGSRPSPAWCKRRLGMAVGIVTNTEIEDATPAAMVAHTRRRAEYDQIVEQYFAAKPDVLMGGGRANFLPKSAERLASAGMKPISSAQFRDGWLLACARPAPR